MSLPSFLPTWWLLFTAFSSFQSASPGLTVYAGCDYAPQIIPQALGWLTFRNQGYLATTDNKIYKIFKDSLLDKYKQDKFYRTFVQAFINSFLPKMSLGEGSACDPDFRSRYTYWYNDSSSDYLLIRTVFQVFYQYVDPNSADRKLPALPSGFCDYRRGLRCDKASRKCACPPGSKMVTVKNAKDPTERCLLEDNQICSLSDIALMQLETARSFKDYLSYMIFDLDKPLGCQDGAICYVPSAATDKLARCYRSFSGSTGSGSSFGQECTLKRYDVGCDDSTNVCYNFGYPAGKNTGFCVKPTGVYGGVEKQYIIPTHPIPVIDKDSMDKAERNWSAGVLPPWINPGNVPLRGLQLHSYQVSLDKYEGIYNRSYKVGKNSDCHVESTNKLIDIVTFYQNLKMPGPGQSYGVDEPTLEAKLKVLKDIFKDGDNNRICKPEKLDFCPGKKVKICDIERNGYKCVATGGVPDKFGNNGKCTQAFTGINKLFEDHDKYQKLYNEMFTFYLYLMKGRKYYIDNRILTMKNTGKGCYYQTDCPNKHVCHEDYSEHVALPIYKDRTCDFVSGYEKKFRCKYWKPEAVFSFGACEQLMLEKKVKELLPKVIAKGPFKLLDRGESCTYPADKLVAHATNNVRNVNGYRFLVHVKEDSLDGGVCNPEKLLRCKKTGKCECIDGTDTRKSGGYESEYCYLIEGKYNHYG